MDSGMGMQLELDIVTLNASAAGTPERNDNTVVDAAAPAISQFSELLNSQSPELPPESTDGLRGPDSGTLLPQAGNTLPDPARSSQLSIFGTGNPAPENPLLPDSAKPPPAADLTASAVPQGNALRNRQASVASLSGNVGQPHSATGVGANSEASGVGSPWHGPAGNGGVPIDATAGARVSQQHGGSGHSAQNSVLQVSPSGDSAMAIRLQSPAESPASGNRLPGSPAGEIEAGQLWPAHARTQPAAGQPSSTAVSVSPAAGQLPSTTASVQPAAKPVSIAGVAAQDHSAEPIVPSSEDSVERMKQSSFLADTAAVRRSQQRESGPLQRVHELGGAGSTKILQSRIAQENPAGEPVVQPSSFAGLPAVAVRQTTRRFNMDMPPVLGDTALTSVQAKTPVGRSVSADTIVNELVVSQSSTDTVASKTPTSLQHAPPVAGLSFGSIASPTAVPTAPGASAVMSIDLHVMDAEWAEALPERVVWLAGRNIQRAEIRLNPAELGPLQVQIALDDGAVNVSFNATHALTRGALESALPHLRELLEQNGLSLADATVSDQDIGGRRNAENGDLSAGIEADENDEPKAAANLLPDSSPAAESSGRVDTYV